MESVSQAITPAPSQKVQQKRKAALGVSHITASLCDASLYVTGLDVSVTEACLHDLFVDFGQVLSVKICRDRSTGASRGCGYVDYNRLRDATEALKSMDFKVVSGKRIRVMFSNHSIECGGPTVFFKEFSASLGIEVIEKIFSRFGTIIASELAKDSNGRSRGFGFVKFDQEKAAKRAIASVDGSRVINHVFVSPFICKMTRDYEKKKYQHFPTLYVSNFHEEIEDEEVLSVFKLYGTVVHVNIIRDPEIFSIRRPFNRGFGFVVFEEFDDAVSAMKGLNGKHPSKIRGLDPICITNKAWYVGWAKGMFKRKIWQKSSSCEREGQGELKKLEGTDLYIKNLDDNISNKFLMRLFSEFDVITSEVMFDSHRRSRGCAIVAFATPEDANKAMNAMNGKIVRRKPLKISVAQRKGKKPKPQAHIAQPPPYICDREPCEEMKKFILHFSGKKPIEKFISESLEDFLGQVYHCNVCGCIFDQAEKTREHLMTYHTFLTEAMVC